MSRKAFFALLVLGALAGPGAAQTAEQNHAGHGAMADSEVAAPGAGVGDEAGADYAAAMERMHGPMMEGIANPDPDVAFVLGMIPHHQGAIDMAQIVLKHGKDPFTRHLAQEVITAQEQEIGQMRDWLAARGITVPDAAAQ
ncbi:CopM family metallochaperone [Aureimonas frigidaquae]|uniref:40-residue YVTN family beta-propeller repeat protein n=1 Tax=Aureimonas frigidaquae TaxID=424757 RepID=A0A0P0Z003_9HYPH|nr:DUF305 domain-containing protein [Aureimonas frigidaquae]BAT27163.1 40-residue YVTN family beta-propeller repeat protein precursor [Aureimonas frigidaquae]